MHSDQDHLSNATSDVLALNFSRPAKLVDVLTCKSHVTLEHNLMSVK